MEASLATYSLAAAIPVSTPTIKTFDNPLTKPIGSELPVAFKAEAIKAQQNWLQRNNITVDSVLGRINQLIGIAGGINNVLVSYKKGQPMQVGNQTLSASEAELLHKAALANQQAGGGQAGNEAMLRMMEQNQQMMMFFIQNQQAKQNLQEAPKNNNTMLFVIGGALLVGILVISLKK